MKYLPILVSLCTLLSAAFPLSAETLHVNLGYLPGQPNHYEEDGVWWNKLSTWGVTSPNPLYTSDNVLSPVTWETRAGFTSYSNSTFGTSQYEYPFSVTDTSFYLTGSTSAQVVISGLEIGREYELTFYGNVRNVAVTRGFSISVQGEGAASMQDLLLTGTTAKGDETEVIFNNIRPDAQGSITLNFSLPSGYDRGVINAITISSIPEPHTMAFGLIGGIALFMWTQRTSGGK